MKGVHFRGLRDAGYPATLAERYCEEGADELVFLDITASPEKRRILERFVREVALVVDMPFTVGGGVGSMDDGRLILNSGADKFSVNTSVVEDPELIRRLAEKFGSQCVVVAIDAKRRADSLEGKVVVEEGGAKFWFEVYTFGARKPTGLDAVAWGIRAEELGAGELLLTSIDRDGTQSGYDLALTRTMCEAVSIPVVASGGCGGPEHLLEVFREGLADAALAASIFHYERYSIGAVKKYLHENGVVVRL